MNRFFTKSIALIALVGAVTVFSTAKAEAAFYAAICNDAACDGVGDMIVLDGSAGDVIFGGTPGAISIGGAMGGLTVLVNTSQTKPALGSAGSPVMDLTYTVTGVGTVWLYATDTDFTGATTLSGNIDGNFSGTALTTAIIAGGNDNTNFIGPGATNLDLSSFVSGSDNVGPDVDINLTKAYGGVSPYFITIGLRIERTSAGTSTGDFLLVPEPLTMALFGLGLAGVAARRRRTVR